MGCEVGLGSRMDLGRSLIDILLSESRERLPESLLNLLDSLLDPILATKNYNAIVSYGLGQPTVSNVSVTQLAVLSHLGERYSLPVSAFDPSFSEVDWELLKRFSVGKAPDLLATDTSLDMERTLFFMPHCELFLYLPLVDRATAILGNSFSSYLERRDDASTLTAWKERGGLETPLKVDSKTHTEEAWLALHSCSLHHIPITPKNNVNA